MKLSTGKVAFPIEFDDGEVREIYFNPTDPNLAVRMKNFKENIGAKLEKYSDLRITSAGNVEDLSKIEDFENIQNILKEEIDFAFGGNIYDVVFKDVSPFALIGGEFFFEMFIKAIAPEIEKHIKEAKPKISERFSKHTNKYGK